MPKLLKPSRIPKRNIGKRIKKRKRIFKKKTEPLISQKVSVKIDLGKQLKKEGKGYEGAGAGRITFDPLPPAQPSFEFPKTPQLTLEDVRREFQSKPLQIYPTVPIPSNEPEEISQPKIEEIEEPIISKVTGKPMRYTIKGRPFLRDLTHDEWIEEIRAR